MKLNLGCGKNKLPDYINIDVEKSVEPDLVCNFAIEKLPYEDNTIEKVCFFHTIEHIPEKFHYEMFEEIHRVLIPEGELIMSYPEFTKCALNYINNHLGQKDFWRATIYGRQLYPSDFHVTLMDTPDFIESLKEWGFKVVIATTEPPPEDYNTVLKVIKVGEMATYEDIIREEVYG
jgi:predicted SAM-dependent methyltransferase